MRRFVNATYMTLDGDIANMAAWHLPYFGEDATRAAQDQLFGSDALIMGRTTYDGFSRAWPDAAPDAFTDRMNGIEKFVVSRTLTDPTWANTTVLGDDVPARLRAIKDGPGGTVLQYGFGPVTRLLLDHGLLDELRIWLHPVLSGRASPEQLLYRDGAPHSFRYKSAVVHGTGLVILSYVPIPPAPTPPAPATPAGADPSG